MIWTCLTFLSCLALTLGEEYHSYYVPEGYQRQGHSDHYNDGENHEHHRNREYDHGGHRQLKKLQESHGSKNYGEGENHALRDYGKEQHQKQGSHEADYSSGGNQNYEKKSHDRGFYEREKKYGYEKAYGYERETKQHDKSNNGKSHGSHYNHKANRGHYNHGGQSIRDLESHGNKHREGSENHGNRDVLIDLSEDHNRGKENEYQYNNGNKNRYVQNRPRHETYRSYLPLLMKNGYENVDNSLERFRHLSGIHGLGGHRGYGLNYGHNPYRYGYNTPSVYRNTNHEMMYQYQPMMHSEQPTSKTYFVRY